MREEQDPNTGKTWIELSPEETKMGFLAQCIEGVAAAESCNYVDMLERMEAADLTEGYILKHYDTLHTGSWDNIISEIRELLHKRETAHKK